MTGLIPILLLGTLILVFAGRLVLQWSSGKYTQPVTVEDFTRFRAALDSVFVETMAIRRIFAAEDLDYISRTGTPDVQSFFLAERKALAMNWVGNTQKQMAQLMDLHLRLASYTYEPSAKFEFRLTVKYFSFVFVSNILLVLLWLIGPFETAKITNYTLVLAECSCSVFSVRLEKVNPVKLGPASGPPRV
jgi:hypothetical protein